MPPLFGRSITRGVEKRPLIDLIASVVWKGGSALEVGPANGGSS